MASSDTIAAIATAPGRGGIGVVRVSGPLAGQVAEAFVGRLPEPRRAIYCAFQEATGAVLDQGIALWFPAPHSYTGEDVLELQGHGGPHILALVLERCVELGARHADAGEFTRRAYLNDKLDLAQAEAVADLIDAESREAARAAVRTMQGAFSREIEALVAGLIELRALVEATLDFPEEEIDFLERAQAFERLAALRTRLGNVQREARQGALLREGLNVVLIGQPNVGKSSLLNALAGFEAAIVTEVAGTTRDTVKEAIQIEGVPLHITDTAGLRDTQDPVEQIGIARTWDALAKADVAILLVDAQHGVGPDEAAILARMPVIPRLTVHNKIDLTAGIPQQSEDGTEIWLSAKQGQGLSLLRERLLTLAGWQTQASGAFLARQRHVDAIRRAALHLQQAEAAARVALELLAEELRLAQAVLSEITGEFSADDLLGEIFGRFCIGK